MPPPGSSAVKLSAAQRRSAPTPDKCAVGTGNVFVSMVCMRACVFALTPNINRTSIFLGRPSKISPFKTPPPDGAKITLKKKFLENYWNIYFREQK